MHGKRCMHNTKDTQLIHTPRRVPSHWVAQASTYWMIEKCCGRPWVWHKCKCSLSLVETSKVVSIVSLALCQTHCKQVPDFSRLSQTPFIVQLSVINHYKLTHIASLQFLPSGQYGLCFGYCFSGLLPLCSHKGEVTFLEPVSRSP